MTLEHFDEYLSGEWYLVATYALGSSTKQPADSRYAIYRMNGPMIVEEISDGVMEGQISHSRMELVATIEALRIIDDSSCPTIILTRQEYLQKYAGEIRANELKTRDGKDVENLDLWKEIETLDPERCVEWRFVKEDYANRIEEWKEDEELDANIARAIARDPY